MRRLVGEIMSLLLCRCHLRRGSERLGLYGALVFLVDELYTNYRIVHECLFEIDLLSVAARCG